MVCARSQYRIDEFARLAHPRDGHPKVLAMIQAYLDESGIHDKAKVCVIGGYFAGQSRWKKFESDWLKLLNKFKVPMDKFHAKNIVPTIKKGTYFENWSAATHRSFLQTIAETIASHDRIRPITAGIVVEDFFPMPKPTADG